ncbi:alpha/beta fold hydrolase [Halospina denitrificans]|nr:alpha/beta fold hydrolase [Halospina denitrificans]
METATYEAILASLEEVSEQYLKATADLPTLAGSWQPGRNAWQRLQSMSGWLPGIRAERIEIDGHCMHYWRIGSGHGTPVVLVHGFGASKENWLSMLPALYKRGITLYVPDLPGFGQSDYIDGARYTYGKQAGRLDEWARRLALPAAHWIGSSMGGATLATLGANHPDRVRSLVLMNAAGMGSARFSPMETQLLQGENPLIAASTAETRALFRIAIHRHQGLISRLMPLAMGSEMQQRAPVNRRIFADMMQPEEPVPGLLDRVSAPTQIVWGEQDRVVDVSCAHHYGALLPNARVRVLRGIGHLPMLEAPLRSARIVRNFWKTLA